MDVTEMNMMVTTSVCDVPCKSLYRRMAGRLQAEWIVWACWLFHDWMPTCDCLACRVRVDCLVMGVSWLTYPLHLRCHFETWKEMYTQLRHNKRYTKWEAWLDLKSFYKNGDVYFLERLFHFSMDHDHETHESFIFWSCFERVCEKG